MALPRKLLKLFAETSAALESQTTIGVFGSKLAGNPQYSTDPDQIQSAAYSIGWNAALAAKGGIRKEDFSAIFYLYGYMLKYMMGHGIAEWLATETYDTNSVCVYQNRLWISLADSNIGQIPSLSSVFWKTVAYSQEVSLEQAIWNAPNSETTSTYNPITGAGYNRILPDIDTIITNYETNGSHLSQNFLKTISLNDNPNNIGINITYANPVTGVNDEDFIAFPVMTQLAQQTISNTQAINSLQGKASRYPTHLTQVIGAKPDTDYTQTQLFNAFYIVGNTIPPTFSTDLKTLTPVYDDVNSTITVIDDGSLADISIGNEVIVTSDTNPDGALTLAIGVCEFRIQTNTVVIKFNANYEDVKNATSAYALFGGISDGSSLIDLDQDGVSYTYFRSTDSWTNMGIDSVSIATSSTVGVVKPDGVSTSVDAAGNLSVNSYSDLTAGLTASTTHIADATRHTPIPSNDTTNYILSNDGTVPTWVNPDLESSSLNEDNIFIGNSNNLPISTNTDSLGQISASSSSGLNVKVTSDITSNSITTTARANLAGLPINSFDKSSYQSGLPTNSLAIDATDKSINLVTNYMVGNPETITFTPGVDTSISGTGLGNISVQLNDISTDQLYVICYPQQASDYTPSTVSVFRVGIDTTTPYCTFTTTIGPPGLGSVVIYGTTLKAVSSIRPDDLTTSYSLMTVDLTSGTVTYTDIPSNVAVYADFQTYRLGIYMYNGSPSLYLSSYSVLGQQTDGCLYTLSWDFATASAIYNNHRITTFSYANGQVFAYQNSSPPQTLNFTIPEVSVTNLPNYSEYLQPYLNGQYIVYSNNKYQIFSSADGVTFTAVSTVPLDNSSIITGHYPSLTRFTISNSTPTQLNYVDVTLVAETSIPSIPLPTYIVKELGEVNIDINDLNQGGKFLVTYNDIAKFNSGNHCVWTNTFGLQADNPSQNYQLLVENYTDTLGNLIKKDVTVLTPISFDKLNGPSGALGSDMVPQRLGSSFDKFYYINPGYQGDTYPDTRGLEGKTFHLMNGNVTKDFEVLTTSFLSYFEVSNVANRCSYQTSTGPVTFPTEYSRLLIQYAQFHANRYIHMSTSQDIDPASDYGYPSRIKWTIPATPMYAASTTPPTPSPGGLYRTPLYFRSNSDNTAVATYFYAYMNITSNTFYYGTAYGSYSDSRAALFRSTYNAPLRFLGLNGVYHKDLNFGDGVPSWYKAISGIPVCW